MKDNIPEGFILSYCRVCGGDMLIQSKGGILDWAAKNNMHTCSDECRMRELELINAAPLDGLIIKGI